MTKPRVLVLAHYYLPGYKAGGPVRSISNLVEGLGDEFDWWIVTADHDFGVREPYPGVRSDVWMQVGKARVYYASSASRTARGMIRTIRSTPHDMLYLNSFFDPVFSILPATALWLGGLRRRPCLVAPRGEFSGGALGIKSWKKRAYLFFARAAGVYRGVAWHASSTFEAADIAREMGAGARVHVAAVLAAKTPEESESGTVSQGGDELRVCFLSRIARMKNLDFALRALESVRARVHFRVYGPREDEGYWNKCVDLATKLPPNVRMTYEGVVPPERVGATIAENDLFFLPTRGENFGHALSEALSAGVPVLTSDRTPWRHLEEAGVGWDLPLTDSGAFARVIDQAALRGDDERRAVRAKCMEYARLRARDEGSLEANRRMFDAVVSGKRAGGA